MERCPEIFEIEEPIGLFATLYYVVAIVRACEERGVEPRIVATSLLYADPERGSDWLAYHFDRRGDEAPAPAATPRHRIRTRRNLNRILRGRPDLDIQNEFRDVREAGLYFDKYLRIKPEILQAARAYAAEHFQGKTLGIHWRGTDKPLDEADPISRETIVGAVTRHGADCETIFIATDEPAFTEDIRKAFPDRRVVSFSAPTGRCFQDELDDNYRKGREALLDCLLLASCDLLIKTPSALSAWSKVFNPDLPVVLVGRPYKEHHRRRLQFLGIKVRLRTRFARPLRLLGFYPESALYDPDERAMARNGVLEIVPESDAPPRRRYH